MEFYGREKEIKELKEIAVLAKSRLQFLRITGRRRVGKTALIQHFLAKNPNSLYFFVSRKKEEILVDEFFDILRSKIPLLESVHVRTLEHFLSLLFTLFKDRSLWIVFDEFQNFQQVNPAFFSMLQKHWDKQNASCKGSLVAIGSIQSMMKNLFESQKEPLFGRLTKKMLVSPFDIRTLAKICRAHHQMDSGRLLHFFAIFGGVARYYDLLSSNALFDKPV